MPRKVQLCPDIHSRSCYICRSCRSASLCHLLRLEAVAVTIILGLDLLSAADVLLQELQLCNCVTSSRLAAQFLLAV